MDVPQTDSGYPTPRDEELPSSSRSLSPITSTPLRSSQKKRLSDHFKGAQNEQQQLQIPEEQKPSIIKVVKPYLELLRQNKRLKRENETFREESMRYRNSSFSLPSNPVEIPKLVFGDLKLKDEIKREITQSFVKIEADPTFFEKKLEEMIENSTKKLTATAYIDIDPQKNDADVQTDVNVHEVSLRIELDDLTSRLEVTEREKLNLENRLFEYEESRKIFESNEQKLKKDIEKLAEKRGKRIEDLEARLTSSRNEVEQIREENRKLVEDTRTHEFEIEEINVKIEEVEKEKEDALKNAEELEKKIQEESDARRGSEEEMEKVVKQKDAEIETLNEKIKTILADEKASAENLKEQQNIYRITEEENKTLKKENEYLTAAQETMIESEMSLKRQIADLTAQLKTTENRLEVSENRLRTEETTRKLRDADVERQKDEILRLTEGREEAAELLAEIRKGKEEIDFLRKEVERAKKTNELEDKNMAEQNRELRKKLEEIEKSYKLRNEELTLESSKHQMEIDFLKQELENRQKSMEEMMKNAENNMKYYNELRNVNEKLMEEYEDYKKNAEHQFFHEVGEHQQMIEHLQKRLVELETYPGQNLSIQRTNQETQTYISTSPRHSEVVDKTLISSSVMGSQVSLISEVSPRSISSPSGSKIEKLTGKLRELITRDLNSSNCSQFHSEVFRQIIEMLENFGNESSSPIAGASRFYESLTRKMRQFEMEWKTRVENEVRTLEEELEKVQRQYLSAEEKLAEEMDTHTNVLRQNRLLEAEISEVARKLEEKEEEAAKRFSMALGFKEEFDFQHEENEKRIKETENLQKVWNEERIKWEEEAAGLRQRLEKAEADVESRKRSNLKDKDVHHNEITELQSALQKMTQDNKDLLKKLSFEKKTGESLKSSFKIADRKMKQFRQSNSERQKTLDYVMKKVKKLEQEMVNAEEKQMVGELYGDIQNKTSQFHEDEEVSTKSDSVFQQIHHQHNSQQQSTSSRRILSNLNQD